MKNCRTIIFSRNRALQADLLLTTLFQHCADIEQESDIFVLHRNDEGHQQSYEILQSEFPTVNFVKETNFKQDLLKILDFHESNISWGKNGDFKPKYVLFLVDDSVICNDFSMTNVMNILNKNDDCVGFSLRLGLNTVQCYPYNCEQKIPNTEKVSDNILKYNWQMAEYDFNYCLELSSSVYPLKNIIEILENCEYNSPNFLETRMAEAIVNDKPDLLMFEVSVAFSIPLNLVQNTHPNRNESYNPENLRLIYEQGMRINATSLDKYISKGAHDLCNLELYKI